MGDEPDALNPGVPRRAVLAFAGVAALTVFLASCAPDPDDNAPDYADELNQLLRSTAQGGRVELPAGTQVVRSTIRLRPGVELAGHADGSTLKLADRTDAPFILANGVDNVKVTGVTFDGGVQSTQGVSLQIDSSSGVTISGCTFIRMKHAVRVYAESGRSASNVVIDSCTFDDIVDFAVRVESGARDVKITSNTIDKVAKGQAPSPSAIYVRGQDVLVQGNTVKSSYDTGVMVAGDDASDVTIQNNTLSTDMVGIYFGSGARSGTVTGNTITSKRDFGIHLHDRRGGVVDVQVTQNTIGPTGKTGVEIEGVQQVVLRDNKISDVAQRSGSPDYWRCGVAISKLQDQAAQSVLVEGNTISGEPGQMVYGVLVTDNTQNIIVQDNQVEGARAASYQVESGDGGPYLVERADGSVVARKGVTRKW